MLVLVTVAWGVVSFYDARAGNDLDPSANARAAKILATFDTVPIELVKGRVENLGISPEVFHALEEENASAVQ